MIPIIIKNHQKSLEKIAKANDISYLALFGSHARNEQKSNSDVDLLIEFSQEKSLFDLVSIEQKMQDKTGKKIDLQTINSISKYIKPYIKKDLTTIYDHR